MYSVSVSPDRLPFRTVVQRRKDRTCAAAALATLLRHHYGLAFSETEILGALSGSDSQDRIAREGPSLLDLCLFLNGIGLDANGHRLSLDQLARMATPAIALLDDGVDSHFVVIKGVRDDRVLIGDPAFNLRLYSQIEFKRRWNGVALLIDPARVRGAFNSTAEWHGATSTAPTPPPLN